MKRSTDPSGDLSLPLGQRMGGIEVRCGRRHRDRLAVRVGAVRCQRLLCFRTGSGCRSGSRSVRSVAGAGIGDWLRFARDTKVPRGFSKRQISPSQLLPDAPYSRRPQSPSPPPPCQARHGRRGPPLSRRRPSACRGRGQDHRLVRPSDQRYHVRHLRHVCGRGGTPAPLDGEIATELLAQADELLQAPPQIEEIEMLAAK